MASQPPADIDETVDPTSRWEVHISLSGVFDFYYIYDRSTKEKKSLTINEENW